MKPKEALILREIEYNPITLINELCEKFNVPHNSRYAEIHTSGNGELYILPDIEDLFETNYVSALMGHHTLLSEYLGDRSLKLRSFFSDKKLEFKNDESCLCRGFLEKTDNGQFKFNIIATENPEDIVVIYKYFLGSIDIKDQTIRRFRKDIKVQDEDNVNKITTCDRYIDYNITNPNLQFVKGLFCNAIIELNVYIHDNSGEKSTLFYKRNTLSSDVISVGNKDILDKDILELADISESQEEGARYRYQGKTIKVPYIRFIEDIEQRKLSIGMFIKDIVNVDSMLPYLTNVIHEATLKHLGKRIGDHSETKIRVMYNKLGNTQIESVVYTI